MLITDPFFYLTAIPAVLIYGIGKGGLGGAVGVVSVPLMALTISPSQAAAILLPILCLMDFFAIRQHYRQANYMLLKQMLPGALVGIGLAWIFMEWMPESGLKLFIGLLALAFCIQYLMAQRQEYSESSTRTGWFWSGLSGLSSTAIHAGGAPISIFLLPLGLNKVVLVATMAVFFGLLNLVKLIPYSAMGGFDQSNLVTALVLAPLAPVGVYIGVWMLHRVSQQWIYRLCYLFLGLSGIKLTLDGLI